MKYLDLLLGAPFNAKSIWGGIIEKTECYLAGWKCLLIHRWGRLTLIKDAHPNLPTYFLYLFSTLVGVVQRPEKLERDFVWVGVDNESKFQICSPISLGGLGIKNMFIFNKVFLGKWLW